MTSAARRCEGNREYSSWPAFDARMRHGLPSPSTRDRVKAGVGHPELLFHGASKFPCAPLLLMGGRAVAPMHRQPRHRLPGRVDIALDFDQRNGAARLGARPSWKIESKLSFQPWLDNPVACAR